MALISVGPAEALVWVYLRGSAALTGLRTPALHPLLCFLHGDAGMACDVPTSFGGGRHLRIVEGPP